MVATVVSLAASHSFLGRIATMPLVTGVFVLVFGGLTLYLQDDHFIKMKPTIVNGLFAAILLRRTDVRPVVPQDRVRRCDASHGGGLADSDDSLGAVLRRARHSQRSDVAVFLDRYLGAFKVFGIMPLTFVFAMAQIGVLKKYEDDAAR